MALLSHIDGVCPDCGAPYGIIDVHPSYVHRGCERCRHRSSIPLPPVRKKVIYLDQSFFSHAWRGGRAKFAAVAERIQRVMSYQLLVAPYSSIHEDETHLWKDRTDLMAFIKDFSRGDEFVRADEVQQRQMLRAFDAWLDGKPADYQADKSEVFRENIHRWDRYFRFDVGGYHGDIDRMRALKAEGLQDLLDNREIWRRSNFSFDDDVMAEYLERAKLYVGTYVDRVLRLMAGDLMALLGAPSASEVVRMMLATLGARHVPVEHQMLYCLMFFDTEHFRQAPYQRIAVLACATLKAAIKAGAYRNTSKASEYLKGFSFDVLHIATYAPYVDAIVVDPAMEQLLARPEIRLSQTYGVKVFSVSSFSAMMAWLDEIEASMSDEHKAALPQAYPGIKLPSSGLAAATR